MSTTMLYRKGNRNHFWKKYFAESAIFNDEDVAAAIDSGEWHAHPSEVPQPGDEKLQQTKPAKAEKKTSKKAKQ